MDYTIRYIFKAQSFKMDKGERGLLLIDNCKTKLTKSNFFTFGIKSMGQQKSSKIIQLKDKPSLENVGRAFNYLNFSNNIYNGIRNASTPYVIQYVRIR